MYWHDRHPPIGEQWDYCMDVGYNGHVRYDTHHHNREVLSSNYNGDGYQ
jgi:hypothetical protein